MDNLYYCDWCGKGEDFEAVDTIVYHDHSSVPNEVSFAYICGSCQEAYHKMVQEQDDK